MPYETQATIVKLRHPTSALLRSLRVGMLMADGAEEMEYVHTWEFLERHGATVTALVVTSAADVVQAYWQTRPDRHHRVELDIGRAQPSGFAAVVIPAALAIPSYERTPEGVVAFLREFANRGRMIGAVCLGPGALIEPGLALGRHLTSWPTLRTSFLAAGAYWEDKDVVVDGNLVTAQRPGDLPEFEEVLLEELAKPQSCIR